MKQESTIAMNRLYLMTFALISVLVALGLEARAQPRSATTSKRET